MNARTPTNGLIFGPSVQMGVGVAGLLGVLANRLSLGLGALVPAAQARWDIIAMLASATLLLDAVSATKPVRMQQRAPVDLLRGGDALLVEPQLLTGSGRPVITEERHLLWLIRAMLAVSEGKVSSVVVVSHGGRGLAAGGVVARRLLQACADAPPFVDEDASALVEQAMASRKMLYLPDLQVSIPVEGVTCCIADL